MVDELAIHGGKPVRTTPFPRYNTIGERERDAVLRVLDSGILSQYLGRWGDSFYGGPEVKRLERKWESVFGIKHAVSMNSATSCLYSAVGALGIKPGDEIIVSPYTMVASVTAAVVNGATPVFADIDPENYCLSPTTIGRCITDKTKAIIVVDLFGYPVDIQAIREVAGKIPIIEDAAQAPGASRSGYLCGTAADIGVFSLNYHKTIHCGEGGMAVTNNGNLATRLQLIRNHGEAVVADIGPENWDIIGYNYRITEIEAAIAYEQLGRLGSLVSARTQAARYLTKGLSDLELLLPKVTYDSVHGYYIYPMLLMSNADRDWFVKALQCEGIPVTKGYVKPIYLEPLYSKYAKRLHVVEDIEFHKMITTNVCYAGVTRKDLDNVIDAFHKVDGFVRRCSSV